MTTERAAYRTQEKHGTITTQYHWTWSPARPVKPSTTSGGPPKDCTRVFPLKGAADALCNPKADVPRCVADQATQGTRKACDSVETHAMTSRMAGDHNPPQASKTSGREGGTQGGNLRGSILKGVLAGLDLVNNPSHGRKGRGEKEVRRRDEMEK